MAVVEGLGREETAIREAVKYNPLNKEEEKCVKCAV